MQPILSCEQMRSADRITIEELGIPGLTLMENAGREITKALLHDFPDQQNFHILCGVGNNAGDGFVIARLLQKTGKGVSISLLKAPESLKGDALTNFQRLKGVVIGEEVPQGDFLIVDALFGVGLNRSLEGKSLAWVKEVNNCQSDVVSVDVPSGLNGDTGKPMPEAIKAYKTYTLGAMKNGLSEATAEPYCGQIEVLDIGIPVEVIKRAISQN